MLDTNEAEPLCMDNLPHIVFCPRLFQFNTNSRMVGKGHGTGTWDSHGAAEGMAGYLFRHPEALIGRDGRYLISLYRPSPGW